MWNPHLLWLHGISDVIISASYLVIAGILVHLVRVARRDVPLQNIFFLFGAFILLCGLTHFLAVVVLWKPLDWMEGDVKLLTAGASWLTAIVLPLSIPRIRGILTSARLSAESERRFLAAANSSLGSIFILSSIRDAAGEIEDFKFNFVNPNAARLISRTSEEILGQRLCELVPFNRTSGLIERYKHVFETGVLRLPIDCLKIDRSIIDGCSTTSNMSTDASAIIALAHQLKLSVVAEGAEVLEEIEFLQHEKCDRVQGFYFSRPLPLDQIVAMNLNGLGNGHKLRGEAQPTTTL